MPNTTQCPRSTAPSKTHLVDASADPCDRPVAVHVRFLPVCGHRLQRREPLTDTYGRSLWTERPLLLARQDGTYDLIGTTHNLGGLARWVLGFGAFATVEGPPALCRRVAREAHRVLDALSG